MGVGKNVGVTEPVLAFFDRLFMVSDELFAHGFE